MQRLWSKAIAAMLIAILLSFNCITTGVYAANIIEQNNATSEKNITFDVKIGNESSHEAYEYTADIDSTDTNLYLNIGVENTGYLKDISVNLENSNYKLDYSKIDDSRIKNITDYTVELNQINTGKTVELVIPIIPTMNDLISVDELGRDSTIKFKATYINEDNKEDTIEKDMTVHLNWAASQENLVGELSQNVIRYLNYDGKTMLSLLLSDALKDSKLPVSSKKIDINVPMVNNLKPTEVIVTAIDTLATNGQADGVKFTNDNYTYDSEKGTLTINVKNEANEQGLVSWVKGSPDKFVITYIYDTNTNEKAIDIHTETTTNTTLLNGTVVTTNMQEQDYTIDSKIGDIATVEVVPEISSLNKGYMYSNKDKEEDKIETEFSVKYRLNVGLAEALNDITIKENGDFLDDIDASKYIYDKKVSVSKDELIKVLGEDGYINVLTSDGTTIGTLNKDTLELDINNSNISFVTSKPQTEGEITLNITKAIKGNLDYTKGQISTFKTLYTKVQINNESVGEISLEEPTSKVNMQISNTNLSTVVKNENVVMNITLERDDITDNLFSNPELNITFPEEITNIDVKDATLLYEDELVSEDLNVNGRTINLKLDGTETKYSSQSTSMGTVIRLVLDLTLNNLSPSKQTNISLSYTNDNDNYINIAREANANINTVELPVNVVAPTGFVTTQSISGYNGDESITAQEEEAIGKLPVLSDGKTATISGTIVNNLGKDAEGLKILGRIPFKGNKQVDGSSDLGSTFDTILAGAVTVENLDATIYYSTNGEATTDLEEQSNGWNTEYTQDAKSYMIVANGNVTNAATFNFGYNVNIPANVDYANVTKAVYGVYYNNNAEEGNKQNVVLAGAVGIKTEDIPVLETTIRVVDRNSGEEIQEGGMAKAGTYIKCIVKVQNSGKETAKNVKGKTTIPSGCTVIENENNFDIPKSESEQETLEFGDIEPGKESTYEIEMLVQVGLETGTDLSLKAEVNAENINGTSVSVFNMKTTDGTVNLELYSDESSNRIDSNQEFDNKLVIKNYSDYEKRNLVVTIKIPEELEYVSGDDNGKYNKNSNTLTYSIDSLEKWGIKSINFKLRVKEIEGYSRKITMQASATFDNVIINDDQSENIQNENSSSNSIYFELGNINYNISYTSNISDNEILDTDELEYYIEMKNESNEDIIVNISDILPEALYCKEYEIVNGNNSYSKEQIINSVSMEETIKAGESLKLTIKAKAYTLPKGESTNIENKPTVTINGTSIELTPISHKINGTGIYNSGDEDNGDNTVSGTYRISGVAWKDENKDGKKEETEQRLSRINVILYSKDGNLVFDANGTQIKATTDEEGKYVLANVPTGEYIVIAEYDTSEYLLTDYRKDGLSNSENSDFVEATLDGKPVAATNIFTISNANFYNTDIGLKEREEFDLKLEKTVSKVTVTNTKLDTKEYEYNSKFAMVSLLNTYVEYSTVLIEYKIDITNEGKIAGYAKEIVDYLPEGMAFSSDLNNNWYLGSDGNAYNASLANSVINPGETKSITLVLTRKMTGENTGTVVNTAEISKAYNEYGLEDGDSIPGNKKDDEDDISTATTLLAMSTGKEIASFIGITLGIISIVVLSVYLIKKFIIKKI